MDKWCCQCDKTKDVSEFYKNKSRKDGRNGVCKSCMKEVRPEYGNYYETERNRTLKKRYGITLDEYNKLHEKQKGLCAICNKPETRLGPHGKVQSLSVDHDHKTGEVRGLLCDEHNKALGHFDDEIILLKEALKYLENHNNNKEKNSEH